MGFKLLLFRIQKSTLFFFLLLVSTLTSNRRQPLRRPFRFNPSPPKATAPQSSSSVITITASRSTWSWRHGQLERFLVQVHLIVGARIGKSKLMRDPWDRPHLYSFRKHWLVVAWGARASLRQFVGGASVRVGEPRVSLLRLCRVAARLRGAFD